MRAATGNALFCNFTYIVLKAWIPTEHYLNISPKGFPSKNWWKCTY